MNGMWLYLKENVKCGTKLSDVICIPERFSNNNNNKNLSSEEIILSKQIVHPIATPIRELIFRQNHSQTWLYELENGNPSRKIVEIIFRKAWTTTTNSPLRHEKRIKSVLKVKNSGQTLERFEKYRETVKNYTKHPRGVVDGNEVLRFHGSTITCRADRSRRSSTLCKDYLFCGVCNILRSNFGADFRLSNAIRLSSFGEDFDGNSTTVSANTKNTERAVIVCRIIAGSSVKESNSQNSNSNNNNMIVCNPNAVLPCFVIVFS